MSVAADPRSDRWMADREDQERAIDRAVKSGQAAIHLIGTFNGDEIPQYELWTLVHSASTLTATGRVAYYLNVLDMRTGRPKRCGCRKAHGWCRHAGAASLVWLEVMAARDSEMEKRAIEALAEIREAVREPDITETLEASLMAHVEAVRPRSRRAMEEEW